MSLHTEHSSVDNSPSIAKVEPPPGPAADRGHSIYPPGATNANWFTLFNSLSWRITLESPTVLYAKTLGAPNTILGIITALTPFLSIFQLSATKYLPKYGYRRFILAGWGSRTIFIFGIAAIPLLTPFSTTTKLALLLFCLFAFNLVRGIVSGAWFPWISELIPEAVRGRFLSRDQIFNQVGSIVGLAIAATTLRGHARPWQFSLVFLISALAATVSLLFLKRTPDVTAPDKLKRSGHRVPWGHMIAYPPFLRLIVFNVLYVLVTAGLTAYSVAFLKDVANYSESSILWLSLFQFLGALPTVTLVGRLCDAGGSKPILIATLLALMLILGAWFAMAAHAIPSSLLLIGGIQLLTGIANINFQIANNRLIMGTVPLMGRNHFFALFTVITSFATGLTPILWGVILDAIGHRQTLLCTLSFNRYSIYFIVSLFCAAVAAIYVPLLDDKTAPASLPNHPRQFATAPET